MRKRLILFVGVILGVLLAGSIRAETPRDAVTHSVVGNDLWRIN
ncbi:hypothetical protein ACFLQW_04120 [Candidatus Zixiibacteriota bacterium]